jgi:regulator of RNase E activity RraA
MPRGHIERVLRWAVIELGTAGLSDKLGRQVVAPMAPTQVSPPGAAIAGPVVIMERARREGGEPGSSFQALSECVRPGSVVLVRAEPEVGGAFGSNVALHVACLRAQALIADGPARDTSRVALVGMPCGWVGTNPRRPGAGMLRVPAATLFGTEWAEGDWFLRDADGVIRLDPDQAAAAAASLASEAEDQLASLLAGA